jgi:hypothetical protein
MRSQLREFAKFVAYRTPGLDRLGVPRYPYKVTPAQLAFMCEAITRTKAGGGSILEIGVAKGDTSVFLLEHMRTIGDTRPLYLVDTFSGFTPESVEHEVQARGKTRSDLNAFSYGKEETFARNIRRRGYTNFVTIAGDASRLDYARLAPIAVVLLDIDLYLPTIEVLNRIEPHMAHPSSIVVDDCVEGRRWDGALQAYREFIGARGMAPVLLGGKGGLITLS